MVSFHWHDVFLVLWFFLFGEFGGTHGLLANTVVRTDFFFLSYYANLFFWTFSVPNFTTAYRDEKTVVRTVSFSHVWEKLGYNLLCN